MAPLAALPHAALQSSIQAGNATGSQWTNPANALTADANYASTSTGEAALSISSFLTGGFTGPISSVTLHLDQSQPNHLDDRFVITQSDPAGCGTSASWSADGAATASRSVLTFALSCPGGWTWARVQSLQVSIASSPNLLVDGEFRVHHAYLQVVYTNAKPVANAGADRTVAENTNAALDGSSSTDPEGDALSFSWRQTAGLNVQIANAQASIAAFNAPALSSGQQVVLDFVLTVTDAVGNLGSDAVRITVTNANLAPVAHAGGDVSVGSGATVTLDGSLSRDPDDDPLTYQWTQTYGPAVALSDRTAARPTFAAPNSAATLEFSLVVSDPSGVHSDADLVAVFVGGSTSAPVDDPNATLPANPDPPPDASEPTSDAPPVSLRIDPSRLLLGPEESVRVRVLGYDAEGRRVPLVGCSWDDGNSGGRLDAQGDCERTFRSGERLGVNFQLVASVATGAGLLSAGARVVVAAVAAPEGEAGEPNDSDEPLACSAVVDPRAGSRHMPVGFGERCALEMVVLEWRSRPEERVRLTARPLEEWPDGVPQPPGRSLAGRILDIHLEEEDGGALAPERATIRFTVPRSWLEAECPPASCMVRLFHYRDQAWESLPAERTDERDDEVEYAAETESFSFFVPGGVPISGDLARGGGFSWGTALAWVGLVASALLLAAFLVKRIGVGRPRRDPVRVEALPLPAPPPKAASAGPSVDLKPAPTDLVPLVQSVIHTYADRAAAAGVVVDVAADAVSLPVVINRVRVGQVATLLLDLATQTAGKKGTVEVRVREQDGFAVVEFAEEPGRAWSSDVPRLVPSVDLSAAARIVEAHRGRLWATNGENHKWGLMVPLRTAADALEDDSRP